VFYYRHNGIISDDVVTHNQAMYISKHRSVW